MTAYRIGVDLGQARDNTVVTAVRVNKGVFEVLDVSFIPLGTSYIEVERRVCETVRNLHSFATTPSRVGVWVDVGGARSFADGLSLRLRGMDYASMHAVQLVAGDNRREVVKDGGLRYLNLGTMRLVDRIISLVQEHRIRSSHPEFRMVQDQLRHYRVLHSTAGSESFGAASGHHDDGVISVALACLEEHVERSYRAFYEANAMLRRSNRRDSPSGWPRGGFC